ncbi:restriction endonuclease [Methylophilus sp. 'Pure River']|uniref:nSTAND3 domain-containing NTPase n=1 Tax=Methylophilus sp. 'Pure River' TaxID=3377117 RepID=UPI00398F5412
MADYDFSTLNDKEFETLCTDLLSGVYGHRFERFKPGKDSGVDGRYFKATGEEVILQCKHWQITPLERLVSHLEKVERPKVELLKPARYILAVSHALSRADKARIRDILSPFVVRDDDILGREDLNDLLSKDPKIERRHYKLWIRSTSVLQHMLNKAIHDRSAYSLEEIIRDAKLYVPTELHEIAIKKLEQLGAVIVTGAPGIGKSTLANHMVLHYVEKGFQLVQIAERLREAEDAYVNDEKQIFYFDDFLGRNYLEALSGHEGSHIMQFIRRITHDKSKRFILTSRTTILNQGKALIDVFTQNNINRNELEVKIESLKDIDKARILYNHIWHSSLAIEYVNELYLNKRYRTVIEHQNFNPRLIRFITDANSVTDYPAEQYWSYTTNLLKNPARVWEHPFEAQLDDFGRGIVLLVTLNNRTISEDVLAEAYVRFVSRPESKGMSGRRDFLLTLRHLVGSFLNRTATARSSTVTLDLFNPSIGDYVLQRYSKDLPSLRVGLISLRSASSISTLTGLVSSKYVSEDQAVSLASDILIDAISNNFVSYSVDHLAAAANFLLRKLRSNDEADLIQSTADFILQNEPSFYFEDAANVVEWAAKNGSFDPESVEKWVNMACSNSPFPSEIHTLFQIIEMLEEESKLKLLPNIDAATVEYIANHAADEFDASEVFGDANPDDLQAAEISIQLLARKKLEEFGAIPSEKNIQEIVDSYDINGQAEKYFASHEPDEDWREYLKAAPTDEIDDLFERTL